MEAPPPRLSSPGKLSTHCQMKHRIAFRSTTRFGFAGVPNALNL
jgi:hypothetical protein